jgi:hypothetical protein
MQAEPLATQELLHHERRLVEHEFLKRPVAREPLAQMVRVVFANLAAGDIERLERDMLLGGAAGGERLVEHRNTPRLVRAVAVAREPAEGHVDEREREQRRAIGDPAAERLDRFGRVLILAALFDTAERVAR